MPLAGNNLFAGVTLDVAFQQAVILVKHYENKAKRIRTRAPRLARRFEQRSRDEYEAARRLIAMVDRYETAAAGGCSNE